jgi:bifunctional UDP-N-acetylglucosamine pyrophosphorylase/glucosamine-1-phosphate N-acetyltransferase
MNAAFDATLDVIVLAAGKGTRMYSDLPKVLHRLAGRPLLEHVLHTAAALGPDSVCVVYGHGGEAVPAALSELAAIWVKQEPQLGTGHAVAQALPYLSSDGVALILYGDVPLIGIETLREMVSIARQGSFALLTIELADPAGYGRIVRNAGGSVARIVEHKDAGPEELAIHEVSTGVMALPSTYLGDWLQRIGNDNAQGEYYLTDIIALAVNSGVPVMTCHPAHEWEVLGVNSKLQLAELERRHQRQVAESLMRQGVGLADPARIDVRGELACGRDVFIDVNCVFEGRVELGDRTQVGANCVLRDVTLGPDTILQPFSLVEKAQAGADCRIGPFSRIRPGTRLASHVHVGNFVELKASQVGDGSKINHLSYVGDSSVGNGVNIGAGTITCNYDGANKHRTEIGDNAFIGSNTALVAPVKVGQGATIGAGSTITKDAPEGELTVARARQATVPGWQRPVKAEKREK